MASTMDIVPTILDWFNITYPSYNLFNAHVKLTGKSLLPLIQREPKAINRKFRSTDSAYDQVFSSHNFHEITMYYPIRVYRTTDMKIIHNLNNKAPYPIAADLYVAPTFLDILNRTESGLPLPWITTLDKYYYRDEWQMFNLTSDPHEQNNLAYNPEYHTVFKSMQERLSQWLVETNDPWQCLPSEELQGRRCVPLYNEKAIYSLDHTDL